MPGDAAIYLETRPAADARAGREAVLVFRTAAGGADAIGGKPSPGGDVRRRRLPIPPEGAAAAWQQMKRAADAATRTLGPRHREAASAAVAAAFEAAGLDPADVLGRDDEPAPVPEETDPVPSAHGVQGAAIAAALAGGPDPLEAVLLKGAEAVGEDEVRRVMRARMDLSPGDPRRRELYDFETRHFAHAYGDAPVRRDETGRASAPVAVAPPPSDAPLTTADGEPLGVALERTVTPLARMADEAGAVEAVRGAQTGLNLLDAPGGDGRRLLDAPLKVDGDPGPKTRAALTRAVARLGAAKVNEAIALGRLHKTAERAAADADDLDLGGVARQALAPLFRSPFAPAARAVENEVLQETLNALGAAPALAVDGDVGPKTEAAFRGIARRLGPDELTRTLADALGLG